MLDVVATRNRFTQWVKSPAFDSQFNAVAKRAIWPFVVGGILILSVAGIPPGIGFLIYGFRRESARKAARRDAHLAYSRHEPILCGLVIGNRQLFRTKGAVAPALLVGTFGPQDEAALDAVMDAAIMIASVYGEDPAKVSPELREACKLVNDDSYRPDRRRQVPQHLCPGPQLWLFDTLLLGDNFESGSIDDPFIPCMATPGPSGQIAQLPPGVAVIRKPANPSQIIHHKERAEPPTVAPHSDNLDAVVNHIITHLGDPERVFHELISTTVHIDVHIVKATPERPWVSLVRNEFTANRMRIIVLDDLEGAASDKWKKITRIADSYPYALHGIEGQAIQANKNQIYLPAGNNSNTFIRHVLAEAGVGFEELPGKHRGNNSPKDIGSRFSDPWRMGQPETPTP